MSSQTKTRIGIGLSFYDDFDSLQRMLHSLESYPFDMLIAVDGRFKGHKGKTPLSDKKTRDLFKTIQTPHIVIDAPDMSQMVKRQIYFDKSKDYDLDVIIIMDSDDYIIHGKTNWPLFVEELEQHIRENEDTYIRGYTIPQYVNQKRYGSRTDYVINIARVFHRPYELQYVENHYTIRNKKTGVNMAYQTRPTKLEHLVMGADHKLRTKYYMTQHDSYEQWQQADEETPENQKERLDAFIRIKDSYPQY